MLAVRLDFYFILWHQLFIITINQMIRSPCKYRHGLALALLKSAHPKRPQAHAMVILAVQWATKALMVDTLQLVSPLSVHRQDANLEHLMSS